MPEAEVGESRRLQRGGRKEFRGNEKDKASPDSLSPHADGGYLSPVSFDGYEKERRKLSYEDRESDYDSEESLYDKNGNRKGYSARRRQRFRSRSAERWDFTSPKVRQELGSLLFLFTLAICVSQLVL